MGIAEINSTLDRMTELDTKNELLMLDNSKLKEEIAELICDKKGLER